MTTYESSLKLLRQKMRGSGRGTIELPNKPVPNNELTLAQLGRQYQNYLPQQNYYRLAQQSQQNQMTNMNAYHGLSGGYGYPWDYNGNW